MPWVVRDAVRDINRTVARRWQAIDPLLPDPASLPTGCGAPLVVNGDNGRLAGLGVCVHHHLPADSLNQTWGAADRFTLVPRLAGQDVAAPTDVLVTQWRDHLAGVAAARGADTSATVVWPSQDITGIQALLSHGLQPLTVIAARSRPNAPQGPYAVQGPHPQRGAFGATIRLAGPADEEAVLDLELRLIRYDMHFGGPVWRPATAKLVRDEIHGSLARRAAWTWLAERAGYPVGLLVAQPPEEAVWIAGMTGPSPAAYLQTMFVDARERGTGIGSALVRHLHAQLDVAGVAVTLLHHSQVNPLSAPFWYRMGYRPLWTSWEARPASALR
ncbi:MAG TPA: GNAT family N-acetyltransferase [Trebonia sp.]|jgi:GNAT superfamily N-acetyltransferase|nr:GNAT family N-acetyltransferase [Trebonia sp.]